MAQYATRETLFRCIVSMTWLKISMVKAKIVWFDRKKGVGEALDEAGRTLFISALEIVPTEKPLRLNPKDEIVCLVRKSKSGFVAKQISKAQKVTKKRPLDATL